MSDFFFFFFSSRRRHTRLTCDWSSDVCSSDLCGGLGVLPLLRDEQAACPVEVVVLVQCERGPIQGVPGAGGGRVATHQIAVEVGGARVVAAVERLPRGAPQ